MEKIPYINSIFEKDKRGRHYTEGALLLQDLLRYSLVINELPLKQSQTPFKLRQLQNWVVRNNKKMVDHYNKTFALKRTRYSKRIHNNEEVINPRFQLLLQLNIIRVIGTVQAEKIRLQIPIIYTLKVVSCANTQNYEYERSHCHSTKRTELLHLRKNFTIHIKMYIRNSTLLIK